MDTERDVSTASAHTIGMCCGAIMRTARQEIAQFLAKSAIDLHPHQFMLLYALKGEAKTLVEVSRLRDLDPSTLAPIVEMFVRQGWVKRDRDPNDRRRAPLTVTPEGLEVLKVKAQYDEQSLLVKSLELMGEEKSQELASLLQEVVTTMATHADDTTVAKHLCEYKK